MKTLVKAVIYLQIAAMFLTSALAGAAAPEKEKPFQGRIDAFETSVVQFPTLSVDASGSGNATHLGRFTMTSEFQVNLLTLEAGGSAHFIAANGDSLSTEFIGQATPIEGTDFSFIVQAHTITGGTGRFAGATGSFTVERLLNRVTGVSSGSFEGTIVIHK